VNKVRRLASLSAAEWRLLLHAAALFILTRIGLAVFGYRRCRATLHGLTSAPASEAIQQDLIETRKIAKLVNAAGNALWPVHMTCLVRSLVLEHLLVRRGIPSTLCFGGHLGPEGLKAHAWVECAGKSLEIGRHEEPFAPFEQVVMAGGHGS
jgi:hypothetical protein